MFPSFLHLFLAFSLCFGLMNHLPKSLYRTWVGEVVNCPYCTGFHCGWIVWLMDRALRGDWIVTSKTVLEVACWGFLSAGTCMLLYLLGQFLLPDSEE